jgi:class 3 adenylate cyclase
VIDSAVRILAATGHRDADGPRIPVGAGIHTGLSYVGAVRAPPGVMDMTALGGVPNLAARLASRAGAGEIVFSEANREAPAIDAGRKARRLTLKGSEESVEVRVIRVGPRDVPPGEMDQGLSGRG